MLPHILSEAFHFPVSILVRIPFVSYVRYRCLGASFPSVRRYNILRYIVRILPELKGVNVY